MKYVYYYYKMPERLECCLPCKKNVAGFPIISFERCRNFFLYFFISVPQKLHVTSCVYAWKARTKNKGYVANTSYLL